MIDSPWYPLVYGRTLLSDQWWRTRPAGVDQKWLATVVAAATEHGRGLESGCRFTAAQNETHVLVGVTCLARELSEAFWTDGNRVLFTFVGLVRAREGCGSAALLPPYDDVADQVERWAVPLYNEHVGADWQRSAAALVNPRDADPVSNPWPCSRPALPVAGGGEIDAMTRWPADQTGQLWNALRLSQSPYLAVTGWGHEADARNVHLTHVTAHDIDDRRTRPARSQAAKPGPDEAAVSPSDPDDGASALDPVVEAEERRLPRRSATKKLSRFVTARVKFLAGCARCLLWGTPPTSAYSAAAGPAAEGGAADVAHRWTPRPVERAGPREDGRMNLNPLQGHPPTEAGDGTDPS